MAITFADPGGEYYFSRAAANWVADGYWTFIAQVVLTSSAPAGRATTYAITSSGGSGVFLGGPTGSTNSTLIVGWASHNASTSWVNGARIFAWTDGASQQCDLRTDASGHVYATRNGTNIGSASSGTLGTGWHYYEVKTLFATGATGSIELRIDGSVFLTVTSVQTTTSGSAKADQFFIRPIVENTTQYYKDIYCLNPASGLYSTYLGDITVNVTYPATAGPSQQFAASTGTQVSCIDDGIGQTGTRPDDTDYIFDSTSGHISDFQFQSITLPPLGSILAAVHVSRLSKDDVGARNGQQYTKSGSTTHTTSSIALIGSPHVYFDVMETDPNTGSAWAQTNLNNATHGVKNP